MKPEAVPSAAKDQLNLVLGFFARVDARASVVLGVDAAMLGYLAGRFPAPASIRWYELIAPLLTFLLLGISFAFSLQGSLPQSVWRKRVASLLSGDRKEDRNQIHSRVLCAVRFRVRSGVARSSVAEFADPLR
jgi:hypothetical protein